MSALYVIPFASHSVLNVGWGDTACWALPVIFCTLSVNITSNYIHSTTITPSAVFIVHYLLWWQNRNTQTEMHFWFMVFFLFYLHSCSFTICTLSTQWVTLTVVSVQWYWQVVVRQSERFGITVLLRRGQYCYSNWSVVTAGNPAIMM